MHDERHTREGWRAGAEHARPLTTPTTIRSPEPRDAEALADLVGQLGYPASAQELGDRLNTLATYESAAVFVAEVDGHVVGLISAHVYPCIHRSEPVVWITALVVDAAHRGSGIGGTLVSRAEAWARARGATKLSVTSASHRAETHAFYERRAYARSGVRFTKDLGSP